MTDNYEVTLIGKHIKCYYDCADCKAIIGFICDELESQLPFVSQDIE